MTEKRTQVCADGKVRGAGRGKLPEVPCLTPDCQYKFGTPGKPGGRGFCHRCHGIAARMIKQGNTSWEELEELGSHNQKLAPSLNSP